MPPGILRFRLRMMRYNPDVLHVLGKRQISADALTRAPSCTPEASDIQFIDEVETFASCAMGSLPTAAQRFQEIRNAQKSDEECTQVGKFCQEGWPLLRPYWEH